MRKETLAYLAGAIDSDGTIGIKKSTYQLRVTKDSTQPTYSERIALRQVQKDIPEMLKKAFDGALYITKPSTENGKPLWSWSATDKKAAQALTLLMPWLRVKREQAKNALELRRVKEHSKRSRVSFGRGHVGASRRPTRYGDRMEALYLRAKDLNRVGI